MRTQKAMLILMSLLLVVGACATAPAASSQQNAEAKRFEPPPEGKARLYVMRPAGFIGSAVLVQVFLDGRALASLPRESFLLVDVEAGDHQLSFLMDARQVAKQVTLEAGRLHFVRYSASGGVTVEDEAKGKYLVRILTRVQTM